MSNILTAINNISNLNKWDISEIYSGNNRMNNMGDALEYFIQDMFADTFSENNEEIRNKKLAQTFSYIGNTSNPPDIMLHNGDAIEVKKL